LLAAAARELPVAFGCVAVAPCYLVCVTNQNKINTNILDLSGDYQ